MRHEFVEYVGLIEKFEYCRHCDIKKDETTSLWCADPEPSTDSEHGFDPATEGVWRSQDLSPIKSRKVWVSSYTQVHNDLLIKLSSGTTYPVPICAPGQTTHLPEGTIKWEVDRAYFRSGSRVSQINIAR